MSFEKRKNYSEEEIRVFEIMKKLDLRVGNALLGLNLLINFLEKKRVDDDFLETVIRSWKEIDEKQRSVSLEELDEETGKSISEEFRYLTEELIREIKKPREEMDLIRIKEIRDNLKRKSYEFGNLPAYEKYLIEGVRAVGSNRKDRGIFLEE